MSTERKMIGLSAQAHFVPSVPTDYGTQGTPSLVVKTTKGTNRTKYEHARKQTQNLGNYLVHKSDHRIRSRKPGLYEDDFNQTEFRLFSNMECSQAKRRQQRRSQFLAIGSTSLVKQLSSARNFEPDSMRDRSTEVHSGKRRWVHPPPPFPKPPGACLFSRRSNPISKININKQAESHPTGILAGEPRVKYSSYHQPKAKAHLLHRIIEKYHE